MAGGSTSCDTNRAWGLATNWVANGVKALAAPARGGAAGVFADAGVGGGNGPLEDSCGRVYWVPSVASMRPGAVLPAALG